MRNDVHLAALRAAARVAFSVASVALVSGCSSAEDSSKSDEPSASNDNAAYGEETASSESAVIGRPSRPSRPRPPCTDASAPKPTCEQVLASKFPVPGDYQYEPVAQPADVVACCDQELTKHGSASKYRWDCCVAYDPAKVPAGEDPPGPFSGNHGLACTPWGPPVPPSMARRDLIAQRRAARERQASQSVLLANMIGAA
jgi:hypothetical protein